MKTRYLYLLRFVLAISDLLIVNLTFFSAFYFVQPEVIDTNPYQQYLLISNLLWLFSSGFNHLYHEQTIRNVEAIYRSTIRSYITHGVLFIFYLAFTKDHSFSRQFIVVLYIEMGLAFSASRFMGTGLEVVLKRYFKIRKTVAVLGTSNMGLQLADFFEKNNNSFYFQGFLDDNDGLAVDDKGRVFQSASEQIRHAANKGIQEVYVPLTAERMIEAEHLLEEAEKQCVRLRFVPEMKAAFPTSNINYFDAFPVISTRREPLDDIENRFRKRVFDIVFSSCVILFLLSWLYPILALIIKIQSPGPVLFAQLRNGRNNKLFWCYKFRSMRINSDSDSKTAVKNDDRVTPIGRFLRKTSLDEVPQFFNVFLGDMSVVGPRPHMLSVTEHYSNTIHQFMVRQFCKPGITGWAQVNGFRGDVADPMQMEKRMEGRVKHDIWYMEHWSSMLDVKIIFMTVIDILKGEDNAI